MKGDTCQNCGNKIKRKRKRKYCSKQCFLVKRRLYQRDRARAKRDKLKALIGDTCLFCDSKRVQYHEIHGKKHLSIKQARNLVYFENPADFVPICSCHHRTLHIVAKIVKNPQKFIELLRNLQK